jgi:hypothetical protein
MKKNVIQITFLICGLVLTLGGCFSPWQGEEGNLTLILPDGGSLTAVSSAEKAGMRYEIILSGPGGTITRTLTGGQTTLTERVLPGDWKVSIQAYADTLDGAVPVVTDAGQMRGLALLTVNVGGGRSDPVPVVLKTVTGAGTWDQLRNAVINAGNGDYIVITADIPYGSSDLGISTSSMTSAEITVIADGNRRIYRSGNKGSIFTLDSAVTVTLGSLAIPGNLTLEGDTAPGNGPLLRITAAGARLALDGNAALAGNSNGVLDGGAVRVENGEFTMNGGTITGNTAAQGGGVYVAGVFTMTGGVIGSNNASIRGGGVYFEESAVFTKTGGIIYGGGINGNTAPSGYAVKQGTGTDRCWDATLEGVFGDHLDGTPGVTGTGRASQILTADTSTLGGSGAFSYQWIRNGSDIAGATGSTYTLGFADIGATIKVRVIRATSLGSAESASTAAITGYIIGDTGPAGGKIFYVDAGSGFDGGRKYMEAAPTSLSAPWAWGHYEDHIMGGTATGFGNGRANTERIVSMVGSNPSSAKSCSDYTYGGYDDWFLPSRDELYQLFLNKTAAGIDISGWHWSSSEDNAANAWDTNGDPPEQGYKNFSQAARPVRSF